jgi:hypothetical protein
MAQMNCPQCGAPLPMRGGGLPYAVCAYCQAVVMRDGMSQVGTAAVLPYDISPIQLGTGGAVDGTRFTVVGRVRWGWSDGSWNEWLLQLSDGTTRWLGEAMGQFQVLAPREDLAERFSGPILLGSRAQVDGQNFTASDIKQVTCLGGEGDLPFACPKDWAVESIDFRSDTGAALSVQRDGGKVDVYSGRYVELAELKPSRLRVIEGWTMPEGLA